MKHDCEYYMNKYLSLDKGERIPGYLSAHIISCPSCRREVKDFVHAEKIASEPLKVPVGADVVEVRKIVAQIDFGRRPKTHRVSIGSWIFFGAFLLISILVCGILSMKSKTLMFTVYSASALAIVAYTFAFFACNLDYFIKRLHIKIQP